VRLPIPPPLDILQLNASLGTLARRPIHIYLPIMLWLRLLFLHLLSYHLSVAISLKAKTRLPSH
jgi:hypothetical protein